MHSVCLERKSRFEVHHTHGASGSLAPSTSSGTGTGSPGHGTSLSRESSQSRVAGDTGLSRDNSATRASRFSIETTNQSSQEAGPPSATVSATGTPNAAQSKRSRFQVSNVEGSNKPSLEQSAGIYYLLKRRTVFSEKDERVNLLDVLTLFDVIDVFGSAHSTPTTSPTGSLMRGQQPALLEALGAQSVHSHLDTLYRQNEQQRVVLNELFAGLGLKPGPRTGGVQEGGPVNSGSVHRQEHSPMHFTLDRQLQVAVRENESLRRENEALKRELDRLRRGGS